MKWIVFVAGLGAAMCLGLLLRRAPRLVPLVWGVVGFLPFILPAAAVGDIGLVSWTWFPGYAHGLEVTLLDLTVLALRLAQRPSRQPTPLRFALLAYLLAVVLSISQADYPLAAVFVVWQLLRMYFVFSVVVRAFRDSRVPAALLNGLSTGVVFTAAVAVVQRYLFGYHEATGAFAHQNMVGMMCNFAVMPCFALLLAGQRSWLWAITPLAGATAVILSLSRGGLLMLIAGLGLTIAFSMRRLTFRKIGVLAAAVFLGGVLLAKAYDQLLVRFTQRSWGTFDSGDRLDERVRLQMASEMMLRDNPLGVGANHFTLVLHGRGYFERAGLVEHRDWRTGVSNTRGIKVHSLYWLTATELGYLGAAALALLLTTLLAGVFRGVWRNRGSPRGDVTFALGVALVLFLVQGLVEWIQMQAIPQYAFWLGSGFALGLGRTGLQPPAGSPVGRHGEAGSRNARPGPRADPLGESVVLRSR